MPQHRLQSTVLHSIGRAYVSGVAKVTGPRPYVKYLRLQNRDNQSMFFWFGLIPNDPLDLSQGTLPDEPSDWDAGQIAHAESVLQTYGMEIKAGNSVELGTASTAQLYSYVASGTAVAHLLIG